MKRRRKLVLNQKVEVRSVEEGFKGSWHCGTVISSRKEGRLVRYQHLLSDEDSSEKLVEWVETSDIVDGNARTKFLPCNYRGWVRPLPPKFDFDARALNYGQCVDVYHMDAWWEGVIFDHQDGFLGRKVFFPDIGDELAVLADNLRITQEWDEYNDIWKPRGNWVFLELLEEIKKDWPILVSVKQIWYDARVKNGFENIKEWTSCLTDMWRELLMEVILDNFWLTLMEFFQHVKTLGKLSPECFPELKKAELCTLLKNKVCLLDSINTVGTTGLLNHREVLSIDTREKDNQSFDVDISRDELLSIVKSGRSVETPSSSSLQPAHEERPCTSSPTITNAPSNSSELPKGNSCSSLEESFDNNHKLSKQKRRRVWMLAGPNIVPRAKYCADAIEEYYKLYHAGQTRSKLIHDVILNVRGHLSFIGWKIEFRKDEGIQRLRYTAPGGNGESFNSLIKVCEYFKGIGSESNELSHGLDSKVTKERTHDEWIPADLPEAELCEDAIIEYHKIPKRGQPPSEQLTLNVLKHLKFLGWKVEYIQDIRFREWRYTPPDGNGRCFRSLFEVCEHLRKSGPLFPQDGDNSLSDAVDTKSLSPPIEESEGLENELTEASPSNDIVAPQYCPQAVINYYSHKIKENSDPSKWNKNDKFKDMHMKAKQHLSSVGWKLYYYYRNNSRASRELRYSSPSGKLYYSLRSACKAYLDEKINLARQAEVLLSGKGLSTIDGHGKRKRKRKSWDSREFEAIDSRNNLTPSDRGLCARKRARELVVLSSSHRNPRTILSWLIDNNVVLPRAKVQYRSRTNNEIMAEGRVTRDGIRCSCCLRIFTLSKFEAHANSTCHQPSANIYLEDGRSLLDCQMQLRRDISGRGSTRGPRDGKGGHRKTNDYMCSVCHDGGELILCDGCPSSFHTCCVGLKEVPDGDWFCQSCYCKICGRSRSNVDAEAFTDESVINCAQCELPYHIGCLRMNGVVLESYPKGYWFCNIRCEQISLGLQKLLGKPIQVGLDGDADLTWTLLKHTKSDRCDPDPSTIADSPENFSKLNISLDVMHECFEPVVERWTRRDLAEDVIFNRWSELNRLNFCGFYTVLLEKNDELISTATVRVFGEEVAEIPLVATRFVYRRRGMCRILMNELEKVLMGLGVKRLVLPAVSSVLNTWISSFGFSRMSRSERLKFLDHTFHDFQGTIMCQKLLLNNPCIESIPPRIHRQCRVTDASDNIDLNGSNDVSEIPQVDRVEENRTIGQRSSSIPRGNESGGGTCEVGSPIVVGLPAFSEVVPCQSEISLQSSAEGSLNGQIKCYKRRRISKPLGSC